VRIIILSGLSGSGKSVALHMLEDLGFYCIDNIPAAMLKPFISYTVRAPESMYERTAIGLDARNTAAEIATAARRWVSAGADTVVLQPPSDAATDVASFATFIGSEVQPLLKG